MNLFYGNFHLIFCIETTHDDRKQLEQYRREHHKLIDYINNSDMEKMNNNSFIFGTIKDMVLILEKARQGSGDFIIVYGAINVCFSPLLLGAPPI